ncbi:unnamed protein product [Orchesella dallaii]|uniref:Uncharacterized protein n=1 Tax=Orchesella dallaii TaxID=48710 RepID=A0ABP1S9L3_9HEXA
MPYFTRQTTQNGALLDDLIQESLEATSDMQSLPTRPVVVSAPGDEIPAEWLIRDDGQSRATGQSENGESDRNSLVTIRDNVSHRSRCTSSSVKTTKSMKMRREFEKAKALDVIERQKEDLLKRQLERDFQQKQEEILRLQLSRKEALVNAHFDLAEEEEEEDGQSVETLENVQPYVTNPLNGFVKIPETEKVADWLRSSTAQEPRSSTCMDFSTPPTAVPENSNMPYQSMDNLTKAITSALTLASSQKVPEDMKWEGNALRAAKVVMIWEPVEDLKKCELKIDGYSLNSMELALVA